jgi:cytochrome c oxidase subunit 2
MGQPMQASRRIITTLLPSAAALFAAPAMAQAPRNWEMGMQPAFSPVAEQIHSLHTLVLWIITAITVFVAGLLIYVAIRFNARRNPVPNTFSHHTGLEIAWTVIPVLILVVIAIPSFRLLFYEDHVENADMTLKVAGHQWYWEYTYPDSGNLNFNSNYVHKEDIKPGQVYLLEVDNPVVLPVGKNVRILTTSTDVIHSFFVPSLGVQRYAIPGRTIETWVRIDKPGTYFGECNQICGTNHSFMPIKVVAVPADQYQTWVEKAKKQFAAGQPLPPPPAIAAAAAPFKLAQLQH